MIIHKFGGTSVGSAERFARVADILSQHQPRPAHLQPYSNGVRSGQVVVVSAMSGVTNQLIAGARAAAEGNDQVYRAIKAELLSRHLDVVQSLLKKRSERLEVGGLVEDRLHELERLYRSIAVLGEATVRVYDAVTSFGEQLSASLLAAALRERGIWAQAISASDLIVTDSHFGAARPLMEQTRRRLEERILPLIEQGTIPVITGYIGATESGITTTLGRGGSDYSAAIIGASLEADEVWIWSDVDGILTADPNIVPQARTLQELSYTEAANLAYFGAEVLHPKTIQPIVASGIPLRLLNSFNPSHPGTRIVQSPSPEREKLPAIISAGGLTLITLGSQDDSWTLQKASRALQHLSEAGVEVPMFSQSFSEHSLNLIVREQDQAHCLHILCREFGGAISPGCEPKEVRLQAPGENETYQLETREKVATISVVGVPGWGQDRIAPHAFAALGKLGTRVIAVAQASTETSVSFCIPEEQAADAVRFLHQELGLEQQETSQVEVPG